MRTLKLVWLPACGKMGTGLRKKDAIEECHFCDKDCPGPKKPVKYILAPVKKRRK